jgi:hypothetical protein
MNSIFFGLDNLVDVSSTFIRNKITANIYYFKKYYQTFNRWRMSTCALRAHVNKINVKKIYWICGVFNSLNIRFCVSLNVIFLFLNILTCAFKSQVKMTLKRLYRWRPINGLFYTHSIFVWILVNDFFWREFLLGFVSLVHGFVFCFRQFHSSMDSCALSGQCLHLISLALHTLYMVRAA